MNKLENWRKLPSGRYAGTLIAPGCNKGEFFRSEVADDIAGNVIVAGEETFTLGTPQNEV